MCACSHVWVSASGCVLNYVSDFDRVCCQIPVIKFLLGIYSVELADDNLYNWSVKLLK